MTTARARSRQAKPDAEKGASKTTEAKPAAPKRHRVGAVVEVTTTEDTVTAHRPDGTTATVRATRGRARYVLDRPGTHTLDGITFEARA